MLYSCNEGHHNRKGHRTHPHAKFNLHNSTGTAVANLLVSASSASESKSAVLVPPHSIAPEPPPAGRRGRHQHAGSRFQLPSHGSSQAPFSAEQNGVLIPKLFLTVSFLYSAVPLVRR